MDISIIDVQEKLLGCKFLADHIIFIYETKKMFDYNLNIEVKLWSTSVLQLVELQ